MATISSQLRQVVMNLVLNASEALGDGSGDICIVTRVGRPQPVIAGSSHSFDLPARDCVCVEITDTGAGMDAATLARIFDPFFTTKFTGAGSDSPPCSGLCACTVARSRSKAHPNAAPRFGSSCPCRRAASRPTRRRCSCGPSWRSRGTILVADDEAIVLQTTDALLRHWGYETVLASDGLRAVERFRASPEGFRAVLLDLTMPGLDRAEVLRAIRATDPAMPALVMSGFSDDDVVRRLRGLGQVAVVRKAFHEETLLAHIAEVAPTNDAT